MALEKPTYIIKKFYPYFWREFKFPVQDDTEPECTELVKNLRKAVWVHRIITFWHWYPFLEKHLITMISSPEVYVSYIFFMVSTTIQNLPNRHESFMTTCSLVTAVAAYVYDKGYLEFLDYSPTILMVLFEKLYVERSGKFLICDHLQEYLIKNNYSKAYEIVEGKTEKNPFADAIYSLDFVREIHFNIKSNISVSKHATVYCHTQEVMEHFNSQNTLKVISTRNVSTQTEHSLQEDLNEQNISEDINTERAPLMRSEKQSLQEDLNEKNISEDINMERTPLMRSEKQSLQEVNKSAIFDNKDSTSGGKKIEVIISNRSSSFQKEQSRQEDIKKARKLESKQGAFVERTEANNLKISSSQPKKLPLEDKENRIVPESKEIINRIEGNEFISAELSSSKESEEALHNDVKKRKRSDSEEDSYWVEMNDSDRIALFQLEEIFQGTEMPKILEKNKISSEENEIFSSKVSPSQLTEHSLQTVEELRISESGQNISTKDTEASNLEVVSDHLAYLHDVEEPIKSEIEQSANGNVTIHSNRISLLQTEQTNMLRMSESIRRNSTEEVEAIDLTISPHSKEKSRISDSEENVSLAEKTEACISKWNLSQVEQSFQEDLVSARSISVIQNSGDNNLKQSTSLQSEENTIEKDIKELRVPDNEQIALSKSSSGNFLSEEDHACQFEAENQLEENYSDAIQHDETRVSTPNSASQPKRKKGKHKSNSKKPEVTEEETTLYIPSKKEALYALIFLIQKLEKSLVTIHALLDIPKNN